MSVPDSVIGCKPATLRTKLNGVSDLGVANGSVLARIELRSIAGEEIDQRCAGKRVGSGAARVCPNNHDVGNAA